MRILYHSSAVPDAHGAGRDHATVTALRGAGHVVRVVGPCGRRRSGTGSPLAEILPAAIATVVQLVAGLRDYVRLRSAIHRFHPDLIYEYLVAYGCGGVLAARRSGVPVLLDVAELSGDRTGSRGGTPWFARAIEAAIVRAADRIVVATHAQKRSLADRGVHPERITVCSRAVDRNLFRPNWNRRSGRIVVGYVGDLEKGAAALLRQLIRRVLAVDDRVSFVVVGEKAWRSHLAFGGAPVGRIRFLTCRNPEELAARLDGMDITLLPEIASLASPGPVLEYMAMETAVVAVESAPVREVVEHGVTGILVPRDDPAALADAVLQLVHEPMLRHRLATNARRAVLQRCSLGAKTQIVGDLCRDMRLADAPIRTDVALPLLP